MGDSLATTSGSSAVPFGHAMLEQFMLDPEYKNLNHGSFGLFPRAVREYQNKLRDEMEASPDIYMRYRRTEYVTESRKAVADLLNVSYRDIAFVKNATLGVNTVLRNLVYAQGDAIIYFADIYAGCEKTIASLVETTPLQSRRIAYTHPTSHPQLVQLFRDEIKSARADGLNVRVAIFDTIVSQPGVRFPFETITEICREEGILSVIDGAHGIGHFHLDLGKLDPDFFISNVHKWLYVPRGCALLYVTPRNQHLVRTTYPTSHGFAPQPWTLGSTTRQHLAPHPGFTRFEQLFDWIATDDDTSYLCIPAALEFRKTVCGGEDAIISYCENLALKAGDRVAEILGTKVLSETEDGKESLLRRCAMVNVQLPINLTDAADGSSSGSFGVTVKAADMNRVARWIEKQLTEQHKTFVPILRVGDGMFIRLSAQIYTQLSDFEWVAEILKGLLERVGSGEPFVEALKV